MRPGRRSHSVDGMNSDAMNVLIAGGGVAGLEAMMALRELAGPRVAVTLLTPDEEFVYRAMSVQEPFAGASAARRPLDKIVRDFGAELRHDSLDWVAPGNRSVFTKGGDEIGYDALILALGAS